MRKLKMQNTSDTLAEIWLDGDVVSDKEMDFNKEFLGFADVVAPKMVREAVEQTEGKNIKIHLNSNGGSVSAGLEIANYLQTIAEKRVVTVVVDSWAASIASVIALSGNELIMPANTYLMIHNPSVSGVSGDVHEVKKVYDFLQKMTETMSRFYAGEAVHGDNYNPDAEAAHFLELMDAETWLTANEVAETFANARVSDAQGYAMCAKLAPNMCAPIAVKDELIRREIQKNLEDAFR